MSLDKKNLTFVFKTDRNSKLPFKSMFFLPSERIFPNFLIVSRRNYFGKGCYVETHLGSDQTSIMKPFAKTVF